MEDTLFEQISINEWRQFRSVDIKLHDRLTILTGSNGSGKSTILKILKCHFPEEVDLDFLATPINDKQGTRFSFGEWVAGQWNNVFRVKPKENSQIIGSVKYSDGAKCFLSLPLDTKMSYRLNRSLSNPVAGISISSYRIPARYSEVQSISMSGLRPHEAYKDFVEVQNSYTERTHYFRNGTTRSINPVAALKEAIISFATFGAGNKNVQPVPELVGLYEEFQGILSKVLPAEIGFQSLEIRTPEVVVVTSSGSFPIDSSSGGLMSIIQLAWQIFLQSKIRKSERFMVLIDEPENHLHPSMQRFFLANIVGAFPKARFVVATHSPFIVSSVKNSSVYALRHHTADGSALLPLEPRSVDSHLLDNLQKAGPANDILREVLGVPVTMPEWSAVELDSIASEFSGKPIDEASLQLLRERLQAAGLSEFFPTAIERMVK